MFRYLLLILICVTLLFSSQVFAEINMNKTVSAVINAYGGKENLMAVETIYAHGEIDDFMRKKSGGYARLMHRPDRLRISIMPEQAGEERVLHKNQGWQGRGNALREASKLSVSSMRYQYAYLDLPMSIVDGSASVSSVEMSELYNEPMILMVVDTVGAPQLRVYIDPESMLIARVETTFSMGGMGSMQLGTEYGDYKIVEGVPFPFTLNNYAGGKISVIRLSNIHVNRMLPDNTFSPN